MKKISGNSLVGILVAVLIVIGAVLFFTTGGKFMGGQAAERADGKGKTLIGKSKYAALDDVCRSNLSQVRQAIGIAADPVEGTFPQSIEEARIGQQFYECAVGKEPYTYDPSNGTVKCPHKGHEKY